MGTFEALTFFGGLVSMIVAIGAAFNAKRSAAAAEVQAGHAETQASAAMTQAKAAAEQVELARKAFDAASRAQVVTNLSVVGKAVTAINRYAAAAGSLGIEAIGNMDPSFSKGRKPDPAYYGGVANHVPDIYPVLTDPALVGEWKRMQSEYQLLVTYVMAHMIELVKDHAHDAISRHNARAPKDMMDAFGRCAQLNHDLLAFAARFDV